ncbi:UDP-N-acetylmuramoyl-L-alanyl-D-glutamate--2,6-diaminopimelate ligase [Hydrogenovibrio sp. 3SP14C1]|uniref:UDP-N-acetylmuramoyl-L-alanyl-D-glutamate--2, 6-diaminopimelate ligase n=1 Tax=Hydrogenovibrio sp. 3SP14C1 TaxID=3038774 RepID=UPI00241736E0|nr:UDP-N-acetylmuramoyl-L-alanyl-D-glutamate--2,6-diaminopimelate ligase [Hydrogenovibrio sp. 3SP14C1]MDG4811800.1 UDP-N-acetylmuramoyl-L-alanyl-D-glutamate--2,6-diaminopimelate ligase [Hydrogenovibrio sp. 3SP14C1]
MKRLAEILTFFELPNSPSIKGIEKDIVALTIDSRQITEGAAFIALSGVQSHGILYAEQAIKNGARCILTDTAGLAEFNKQNDDHKMTTCPVIEVPLLDKRLADFAKWFYDAPSERVKVIGVTGTNGKTSSSHYMAQMLNALNYKVALMGTLGNGWFGALKTSQNTTVDVVTLNHLLNDFAAQQADYVVMEVSSHAIELGRIAGIGFEVLAMTQVTRDHLDFHHTEAAYQAVKKKLFLNYPSQYQVLNVDDLVGQALLRELPTIDRVISYSQKDAQADIVCLDSILNLTGMQGTLIVQGVSLAFELPLMGQFNLENVLCAVSVLSACGLEASKIQKSLASVKAVSGRMELLIQPNHPTVLVDYAHTPDALEAVLKATTHHASAKETKLWVVFGCGGDRDTGKRPLMGKVAETYADEVVLTDDNPRGELPEAIIADIKKGMHRPAKVIHDRPEAIAYAVKQASSCDMVVIAGKGHEDYQEIKGKRWPMSDQKMVKELFSTSGAGSV